MSALDELNQTFPSVVKIKELEAVIEIIKREFPNDASIMVREIVKIEI